jgi:hypothetical protein
MTAPTISQAGTNNSTTSGSSLTVSVTASVGDFLVLIAASDNSQTTPTAGGPSMSTTVTDAVGNTWTNRSLINRDPGAANAGATLGIWTCSVKYALSAQNITLSFSPNTPAKAAIVWKLVPASGESIVIAQADATGSGVSAGVAVSRTTGASVPAGDISFGGCAIEGNIALTADTDTSGGVAWSSAYEATANTGTDTSSMKVSSQYKIPTSSVSQIYNVSWTGNHDGAVAYLVLRTCPTRTAALAGAGTLAAAATKITPPYERTAALSGAGANAATVPRFIRGRTAALVGHGGRRNQVSSPDMSGAATGTPGTYPTGWESGAIDTRTIVGYGTLANGESYIDIRWQHTNPGGTNITRSLYFCDVYGDNVPAPAKAGETWSYGITVSLVAGSLNNVYEIFAYLAENDDLANWLAEGGYAPFGDWAAPELTSTPVRKTGTRTLTHASTDNVTLALAIAIDPNRGIDLTFRITSPQLVQGVNEGGLILGSNGNNYVLAPQATKIANRTAALAGAGTVAAQIVVTRVCSAALAGAGTVVADGGAVRGLTSALVGGASSLQVGGATRPRSAALAGAGGRYSYPRGASIAGAVAGIPGTAPSNWLIYYSGNGLSREIVGFGVDDGGNNYVDARWFGTISAGPVTRDVWFETNTAFEAPCVVGDDITFGLSLALVGGDFTGISSVTMRTSGFTSTTTYEVSESADLRSSLDGELRRFGQSYTCAHASVTKSRGQLRLSFANGAAVDVTLRIATPVVERMGVLLAPIHVAAVRSLYVAALKLSPGSAALSGAGTLAADPTKILGSTDWERDAAFGGAATVVSVGARFNNNSAALSGAGALAVAVTLTRSAVLSGAGTAAAVATRTNNQTAALTGAGAIAAASGVTRVLSASLLGAASSLQVGGATRPRQAALTGAGALTAPRVLLGGRTAALAGAAILTAPATRTANCTVENAGAGLLAASATPLRPAASVLAGAGTLAVAIIVTREAALAGAGALAAVAIKSGLAERSAILAASGSLAAVQAVQAVRSSSLLGAASSLQVGGASRPRAAVLAATGTLVAPTILNAQRSAILAGAGSLAAVPIRQGNAAAALDGSGAITVPPVLLAQRAATLAATTSLASIGRRFSDRTAILAAAAALAAPIAIERVLTASLLGAASNLQVGGAVRPRQADFHAAATLEALPQKLAERSALNTGAGALTATPDKLTGYLVYPTSDASDGAWLDQNDGTDLFAAVDEASPSDADYIKSPSPPADNECELAFSISEQFEAPVLIRYRAARDGDTTTLTVKIVEGTTVRATRSHELSDTFEDYEQVLTPAEIAAITDWTDVRVRLAAS